MDITLILPILVTALIPILVGMIWYAKAVFGARWMRYESEAFEMQQKTKSMSQLKKMSIAYVGFVLLSYTLSELVMFLVVASLVPAVRLGFLLWAGIALPVSLIYFMWTMQPKPLGWLVINAGYLLVSIILMTVVLALWV